MGHDPFAEHFERDYLSVGDLARIYGVARDVSLRLSQFGMRDTVKRGGQRGQAMKEAKPVVWFVEHPGKPVFLNRGAFETLLDRFGEGYWRPDRRAEILYAPQRIRIEENSGGRDGIQFTMAFIRGPYHDHRAPLGQETADKIVAAVEPLGWTRDKFRSWVRQNHPDLLAALDATETIADMPRLMAQVIKEWEREAKSDVGRHAPTERPPQPPQRDRPAAPPARPAEDHGGHSGGFLEPGETITHDDIPF